MLTQQNTKFYLKRTASFGRKNEYYKNMDMEAYEVVRSYANISDIIQVEKYREEDAVGGAAQAEKNVSAAV